MWLACRLAGEHCVQLLSGLLSGQQAVHGVGGETLRIVNGGGVAETGRGAHIVDGQPDGQLVWVCRTVRSPPADIGDGPAVAVFDPVGGGGSESAVVAAGDDHISDTGLVPVGRRTICMRRILVEVVVSGSTVEFGDQLAGEGEHDGVKSG